MKKVWILLLCIGTTLGAHRWQEKFLQGNMYAKEGKLEQALEEYDKVEKKGAAILFNMGNCHYQLGQYLDALIAWRKAEKQQPTKLLPALAQNITSAQIVLRKPTETKLYWNIVLYSSYLPLYPLQLLSILCWFALCAAYWFKREKKLILISLACSVLLFTSLLGIKYYVTSPNRAVVIIDGNMFVGADDRFHSAGEVTVGDEVDVVQEAHPWYKIRSDKKTGWVKDSIVKEI